VTALRQPITDGAVTIRAFEAGDADQLIAGRDREWRRWLGPAESEPRPTACIVVADEVVGWIDFDVERAWLRPGEVNVGYSVFPPHRRKSYASRAVLLMLRHLDRSTAFHTATLLIHPDNQASLAVAAKAGFAPSGQIDGSRYFKRAVGAEA
jgi:RimJ/RimL family protein N-acetyltransferase